MQDLEKKEAVAEKKRESIMVGLNQTKGQVSSLEAALARNQTDLEKAHFELDAAKGVPRCPTARAKNPVLPYHTSSKPCSALQHKLQTLCCPTA